MKILAIVGSPRPNGNTNYLVDLALKEAESMGVETEKIALSQYKVNPCLGHDRCAAYDACRQKDDAGWILDRLCEADGVILATPVYYYGVSAQMKAFIDRNYFLYTHKIKSRAQVVGIIVVAGSEGIEDTVRALKIYVSDPFKIKRENRFIVTGHANKVGDAKKNLPLVEEARKLGRHMAESLKEGS